MLWSFLHYTRDRRVSRKIKDGLTRNDSRTCQGSGALGLALSLVHSIILLLMSFVTWKKMNLRATAHCLVTKCLSKNLLKIQSQKYPLEEGKTEKGGLHATRPSVPGQQCHRCLGGLLAKPEAGDDDGSGPLPMGGHL